MSSRTHLVPVVIVCAAWTRRGTTDGQVVVLEEFDVEPADARLHLEERLAVELVNELVRERVALHCTEPHARLQ